MEQISKQENKSCCGCTETRPTSADHAQVGGPFTLLNHHGELVTRESYRGRFVLMFFGFTNCQVVCPRALQRISDTLSSLGKLGEDTITPLYITVDPERDTPEIMGNYVAKFSTAIVGLTGSRAQIDAVMSAYRIFGKPAPDPDAPGGYVVPHTAITYLLGPDGAYLDHFFDSITSNELAGRLRQHIAKVAQQSR